jgi:Raf kinase inhibitor-like YbhB/YbcL family protein
VLLAAAGVLALAVGCVGPAPTPSASATLATVPTPATTSPGPSAEETRMAPTPFTLTSSAFTSGGTIPKRYTCDGEDVSPPLSWSGVAGGAGEAPAAYALIVDDPDANGFVHWVAVDIPGTSTQLPEGARGSAAGIQGRNDFGRTGYGGPCPPRGRPHGYVFQLLALSRTLGLKGTPTAQDVRRAAAGATLAEATLSATYTRGGG